MIKTYRHKGLKELFEQGATRQIEHMYIERCRLILQHMQAARQVNQLGLPGWHLHPLHQHKPLRWSIRVQGPWRITFEFENGDAYRVDFENYHDRN